MFDWEDTIINDDPSKKEAMAYWDEVSLVPGVYDQLEYLNNSYNLYIVSNAEESNALLMMGTISTKI